MLLPLPLLSLLGILAAAEKSRRSATFSVEDKPCSSCEPWRGSVLDLLHRLAVISASLMLLLSLRIFIAAEKS